jgi:hypothetical protein
MPNGFQVATGLEEFADISVEHGESPAGYF